MNSTNGHSNPCLVGGDVNFTGQEKQPVEMRQFNEKREPLAGKGPSRLKVEIGPNTEIPANDSITARDENNHERVEARATCKEGTNYKDLKDLNISQVAIVMVGRIAAIKQALDEQQAEKSKTNNQVKDRE